MEAGAQAVSEVEMIEEVHEGAYEDLQEAYISLFLDRHYRAELVALVSRDGDLWKVHSGDLLSAVEGDLPEDLFQELKQIGEGDEWILLSELEFYSPVFNLDNLRLRLTTPPEERNRQTLDFRSQWQRDISDSIRPQPASAYLNIKNLYTHANNSHEYKINLDGPWHRGNWVVEARGDIDTERSRVLDYHDLRAVRDYPDTLARLTIGETLSLHPRLLSSDTIQGVRYATDFNMQPTLITEPISEFTFLLERDSLVEIWVNGEQQKFMRLPAGPYDIRSLSLTSGFNEVVIKLTDDLGEEELLTFQAISGPNLLAPGRHAFSYSIGVRGGGRKYTDEVIGSAFYRRGVSERLTLSVEGQAEEKYQALGVGCDFASSYLYGSLDTAVSHMSPSLVGGVVRAVLGRELNRFQFAFRFDLQTREYLSQTQNLSLSRTKMSESFSLSGPLSDGWGSLNAHFVNATKWAGGTVRTAEVRWEKRLSSHWRMDLAYLYSLLGSPQQDVRFALHYTVLGDRMSRNHVARYRSEAQALRNSVSGRQGSEWCADWKLAHHRDWTKAKQAKDAISGVVRRNANRCTGAYSVWVDDVGSENRFRHHVNFSTAIAYVDGQWAVGRPITDSFAIVSLHPSLDEPSYQVVRAGQSLWAATPQMGALVHDLRSYIPVQFSVEGEAFEFETQPFLLFPSYKTGTHVVAGGYEDNRGPISVTGVLVDGDGVPLEYKALIFSMKGDDSMEPFFSFTNEKGRFRAVGLRPGETYSVKVVDKGDLSYELEMPLEIVGIEVELGTLNVLVEPVVPETIRVNSSLPINLSTGS